MFTFLHAADIHLDSPLIGLERYPGAPVDEIRGATRKALQNLVDLAVREEAAFVLIAGDIFDGDWRDYNTGDFFRRQMSVLDDHDIPVITIKGNHDAASQISRSLKLPKNVKDLDTTRPQTVRLEDFGVAIHGQGFSRRDVTDDLSARYPAPDRGLLNIGLLHTCAEGAEGHDPYAPCTLPGLRSREYEYWALGHIHTRALLYAEPHILFPGNIQGRSVRECGPRGCSLVRVDKGAVVEVRHRDLDVVRWHHVKPDVSGCACLDDVLIAAHDAVLDTVKEDPGLLAAVRVSIAGVSAAHSVLQRDPERLVLELRTTLEDATGGRVWLEKVEVATRLPVDLATLAEGDAALGMLLRQFTDLAGDETTCAALAAEFHDLKHKLPRDVQALDNGVEIDEGTAVVSMLGEVEQMLLSRLLETRAAE